MLHNERTIFVFDSDYGRFLSIETVNNNIHCSLRVTTKRSGVAFRIRTEKTPKVNCTANPAIGITDKSISTQITCMLSSNLTFNDLLQPVVLKLQVAFLNSNQFRVVMHDLAIESLLSMVPTTIFRILILPRKLAGDPHCLSISDILVTSCVNERTLQYRSAHRDALCPFKALTDIYTSLSNRSLLLSVSIKHAIDPRTKREYTDDEESDSEVERQDLRCCRLPHTYRNANLPSEKTGKRGQKRDKEPDNRIDERLMGIALSDYGAEKTLHQPAHNGAGYAQDHAAVIKAYSLLLDTLKHDILTWIDMPLQTQIAIVMKACRDVVTPIACPACSSMSVGSYTICHRCGCAIGCCTDCARSYFALHKAECDMLFAVGIFQALSRDDLADAIEQGNKAILDNLKGVGSKAALEAEMIFETWNESRRAINALLEDADVVVRETEQYLASGQQSIQYLKDNIEHEDVQNEYKKVKDREIRSTYWPGDGCRRLYITENNLKDIMTNIKENKSIVDIHEGISRIKASSDAARDFLVENVGNEDENVRAILEFLLDNKSIFPEVFTEMISRMRYAYMEQLTLLKEKVMEMEEEILSIDYHDQIHRFEFIECVAGFVDLLRPLPLRAPPSFLEAQTVTEQAFISEDGRTIKMQSQQPEDDDQHASDTLQEMFIELTDSATSLLRHELDRTHAEEEVKYVNEAKALHMKPIEVRLLKSLAVKPQILQLLNEVQSLSMSQARMSTISRNTNLCTLGIEEKQFLKENVICYCEAMREVQAMLGELRVYCSHGINALCPLYKDSIKDWPLMPVRFSVVEEQMSNAYDVAAFLEAKLSQVSDLLDTITNELHTIQTKINGKVKQFKQLKSEFKQGTLKNESLIGQIDRRNGARQGQYLQLPSLPLEMRQTSMKSVGSGYAKISNYAIQDILSVSSRQADRIMTLLPQEKIKDLKDVCGTYVCKNNSLSYLTASGKYQHILSVYIRNGIFYSHSQASLSARQKYKIQARRNSIAANHTKETDQHPQDPSNPLQLGFFTPKSKGAQRSRRPPSSVIPSEDASFSQHVEYALRQKLTKERIDKLPSPASTRPCPRPPRDLENRSTALYDVQSISAQVDETIRSSVQGSSQSILKMAPSPASSSATDSYIHNISQFLIQRGIIGVHDDLERYIHELNILYPGLIKALAYDEFVSGIEYACGQPINANIFTAENEFRATRFLLAKNKEKQESSCTAHSESRTNEHQLTVYPQAPVLGLPPRSKSLPGLSLPSARSGTPSIATSLIADSEKCQNLEVKKRKAMKSALSQRELAKHVAELKQAYKQASREFPNGDTKLPAIRQEISRLRLKTTDALTAADLTLSTLLKLRYIIYKDVIRKLEREVVRTVECAMQRRVTKNSSSAELQSCLGRIKKQATVGDIAKLRRILSSLLTSPLLSVSLRSYFRTWLGVEGEASNLLNYIDKKIALQIASRPQDIYGVMRESSKITNASIRGGSVCIDFGAFVENEYCLLALFDLLSS